MPKHHEIKQLPYTPDQLFQVVLDVEKYPEFLPWCTAARINTKTANSINADLVIGYKMFREKFTSVVTFDHPDEVRVSYEDGPFKYLRNIWKFSPVEVEGKAGAEIDFFVDFEFKSGLLQAAIQPVFSKAVFKMIQSFESRAAELYS